MTALTGKFILLIGPSGSGKSTLAKHIKQKYSFKFPVSCTTRPIRENEVAGENYHFIDRQEFLNKIQEDAFLEWAQVHNENYYGTLKSEVIPFLESGKIVFREIDIQGAKILEQVLPSENIVKIFVTAESWDELKKRIKNRSEISAEEVEDRHQSFLKEQEYSEFCNYILINKQDHLPETIDALEEIIAEIIKS